MTIPQAIILGLIQGLTEFLPVSSSAHLSLWQIFFDAGTEINAMSLEILMHLATLCAVLTVYISDIMPLIPAFFNLIRKLWKKCVSKLSCKRKKNNKNNEIEIKLDAHERMIICLVVATAPLAALSPLKSRIEAIYLSRKIIGIALILNAGLLFVCDIISQRRNKFGICEAEGITVKKSALVGLFQCMAVVPGISRSGSTTLGGLVAGLDTENALRFSFLLSVPVILGANALSVPDLVATPIPQSDVFAYACGMAAALVSGIAAIALFRLFAKKGRFVFFALYCAAVGSAVLIFR